jgi:hypothetical protein
MTPKWRRVLAVQRGVAVWGTTMHPRGLQSNDLVERPGTMSFRTDEHAIHCEHGAATMAHGPPRTRC